jgi:3-hydroxyacyl-[acyl-carrier-protein] dehydratase
VRFHLIDKVDSYEPSRTVRARKLTSLSEEYWEPSDDGVVMPPPLVLEALCQAGSWLVMISTERRKRAALLSIGSVSFLEPVTPGDIIELEGAVDSMRDDAAVFSGRATVDGRPVLETTEIMCALVDAQELADIDDTKRLQDMLTRSVEVS